MCHWQFAFFTGLRGRLTDVSHICIFRIFSSVPLSPSLALPGWLFGPVRWAVAEKLYRESTPITSSWNLQVPHWLLGEHWVNTFSSHRWSLKPYQGLHLSQIFPSVWHGAEAPLTLHHFGFGPSCALLKPTIRPADKFGSAGACSPWDVRVTRERAFLVRQRCSRACCYMVEFGQGGS